jgi:uncharacterized protein YutE (UPF0331/DUF86 family)
LEPLQERSRAEFDADPYLRDIAERNLEVAAQCCIDISHRIISLEQAKKPADSHESVLRLAELGILDAEFARRIAPIAGFRNILVHEYLGLDWDEVYRHLQHLDDLLQFADSIGRWLQAKE